MRGIMPGNNRYARVCAGQNRSEENFKRDFGRSFFRAPKKAKNVAEASERLRRRRRFSAKPRKTVRNFAAFRAGPGVTATQRLYFGLSLQQNALCPVMPEVCKTPIMLQIMPLCRSIMASRGGAQRSRQGRYVCSLARRRGRRKKGRRKRPTRRKQPRKG